MIGESSPYMIDMVVSLFEEGSHMMVIDRVIDEISIFARHDLAHAFDFLFPADKRKQDQSLQAVVDCFPHTPRAGWTTGVDVVG